MSLLAFSVPLLLQAQITVSIQLPPAGLIQKDQLWNLVLVNNGSTAIDANVLMSLQDAVTGQNVLSAGSRNINLNKGVKVLSVQDVQPIQYTYGSATISGSYLPLGSYIACYTVSTNVGEKVQVLADECARVNINPLSPPILNSPSDKSELSITYPQLSWTPPAPIDMFDNLNYDVAVAEVMQGQSPTEAILYNTPVYVKSYIKTPYENYPSSYSRLEPGKTYAWQVIAKNGLSYSAATEVWTFNIKKDSILNGTANDTYILLKVNNNESGVNYVSGKGINVKYYSFEKEHETTVRFLNAEGKLLLSKKQKIIYGDNFFQFNLNNRFQSRQVYFIEITDQQNNKHTASFSIN